MLHRLAQWTYWLTVVALVTAGVVLFGLLWTVAMLVVALAMTELPFAILQRLREHRRP